MMSSQVLLTGAAGFVGQRLSKKLLSRKHALFAFEGDVRDHEILHGVFKQNKFTHIVHLGGWSHVPSCEQNPTAAYDANLGGTALLIEAMRQYAPTARVIFASTAQVYAPLDGKGGVLSEQSPIKPSNVYSRSKRAAESLLEGWHRDEGAQVTLLRIFNHTHKTQAPLFFLPYIYHALLEAKKSGTLEIPVGNLDVERDIGLVDDLVEAIVAVIEAPQLKDFEIFNVCSGHARKLSHLAHGLADKLGLSTRFVTDPSRVRAGEAQLIVGSQDHLHQATGWKPPVRSDDEFLNAFLADS